MRGGYLAGSGTYTYSASGHIDYKITVINPSPTSISIPGSLSLDIGNTRRLEPNLTPVNAVTTCSWRSSDESVARVDKNGVVTGVSDGTARIKITTSNGKADECEVIVSHTHKWTDWQISKEPSCTEDGSRWRKCAICGIEEVSLDKAVGHALVMTKAKEPTSTVPV